MRVFSGIQEEQIKINGSWHKVMFKPNDTLLHVLRNQIGYTGSKPGCENGDCGACTVLVDGKPIKSCVMLAVDSLGKEITTVEGIKGTEIQKAFVDEGGFQCGYCTSGFLMNAYALLKEHPDANEETKKDWLSANLCRCTGYEGIKHAVDAAQEKLTNEE